MFSFGDEQRYLDQSKYSTTAFIYSFRHSFIHSKLYSYKNLVKRKLILRLYFSNLFHQNVSGEYTKRDQ